jgi:general stress protein YciG
MEDRRRIYGSYKTSIRLVNRAAECALHGTSSRQGRRHMPTTKTTGSKRGFAAMDPAKQREIASKGGKASHGGGRRGSAAR